jgi:hypothetical protein
MKTPNSITDSPFSTSGGEYVQQLNYGRTYGDENQGGHHKKDQGNNHFNSSLGSLFFGALSAFGTQRVGMNTQGLGNTGSETVGLNKRSDQRTNVVNASPLGKIAKRFDARFSGPGFKIEEMKFTAQLGMSGP